MIAVDGSPLRFGPTSVARMLRAWIAGWPSAGAQEDLLVLTPTASVRSARQFRRSLPARLASAGATGLLSPWMAVPDLRAQGVPVVAMVHELPFVRHGPIEGRMRAWRQRVWLRRDAVRCARLLAPCEFTREDVASLAPELGARTVVVPHGFNPAPWEAARRAPEDPPYAVMVGVGAGRAHAHKKGLDVMLAAWRKVAPPSWRLKLIGEPALPVPTGIEVLAPMEHDQLRPVVAGASLLIYPSRMEGFGFPPLEAMAAGVPVLATDAGSIPEVVSDAAHVVRAGDEDALAEGVRMLTTDSGRRAALVERGSVRARAFPVEASARRIIEVFASVGVTA